MRFKTPYFFLVPALALIVLVAIFPLGYGVGLSLMRRMPVFHISQFVGPENFYFLLRDVRFWQSAWTTVKLVLLTVPFELALGLTFALLLREKIPGGTMLKIALMVPWAIPTVVSARMWEWIFNPEYGILNFLLINLGIIIRPINWLGNPHWTMPALVVAEVWKTTPFAALLLYAGLQTIPEEIYEAAQIDGAGSWARFRYITLPLIFPVLLIVAIFRTMDTLRIFDLIYVLTGGGPANMSETLSIYAYKLLFQTLQFGYGSTVSLVTFFLIALFSFFYILILQRKFRFLQ